MLSMRNETTDSKLFLLFIYFWGIIWLNDASIFNHISTSDSCYFSYVSDVYFFNVVSNDDRQRTHVTGYNITNNWFLSEVTSSEIS